MVQLGRSARKKKGAAAAAPPARGPEASRSNSGPVRASALTLSSGISLDGQSLQLPDDYSSAGHVAASALLGVAPSLDGESLMLPPEDDDDQSSIDGGGLAAYMNMLADPSGEGAIGRDFADDISSINDESIAHPNAAAVVMDQNKKYLRIVGSGSGERITQETGDSERRISGGDGSHSAQTPSKISIPTSVQTAKTPPDKLPQDEANGKAPRADIWNRYCYCCPVWIRRAPAWLKVVFAVSLALLLAAMALVVVGVTWAVQGKQDSSASSDKDIVGIPTIPPTMAPAMNPAPSPATAAPSGTGAQTNNTDGSGDGDFAVGTNPNVTTFFATGGRYPDDVLGAVPALLESLPVYPNGFMVHLGDWNLPTTTGCTLKEFYNVSALYRNSSLPVYFVVGDNEYNDCINPNEALSFWTSTLVGYETKYWSAPSWQVSHQDVREENFAFFYNDIIFVGIDLVAGTPFSNSAWSTRLGDDLDWIDTNYGNYINQGAKVMVLLCNSSPTHWANADFFSTLFSRIQSLYTDMRFVIVHRNTPTEDSQVSLQYNNITNLDVVTVSGSVWPPMKIDLDFSSGTVQVKGDQMLWYENLKAAQGGRRLDSTSKRRLRQRGS